MKTVGYLSLALLAFAGCDATKKMSSEVPAQLSTASVTHNVKRTQPDRGVMSTSAADPFEAALFEMNGNGQHLAFSEREHAMRISPSGALFLSMDNPSGGDTEAVQRRVEARLTELCNGEPGADSTYRAFRPNRTYAVSTCTQILIETSKEATAAIVALEDAVYDIRRAHGSFDYEDPAIARLEDDAATLRSAMDEIEFAERYDVKPDDVVSSQSNGQKLIHRADGNIQRVTEDGNLEVVDKEEIVAAHAGTQGRTGSAALSGETCGFPDLEGEREVYNENVALQRKGGQTEESLLEDFDAAWARTRASSDAEMAKLGHSPEELVRLATLQVKELRRVQRDTLGVVDNLADGSTRPDCSGSGGSASGSALCTASSMYLAAVQVAMYCHAAAEKI